jgi:hypothetical protein
LRARDLRATFITISLANGRTREWCQQRTGHGDSMKQKYRRTAVTWVAQQVAAYAAGSLMPQYVLFDNSALKLEDDTAFAV